MRYFATLLSKLFRELQNYFAMSIRHVEFAECISVIGDVIWFLNFHSISIYLVYFTTGTVCSNNGDMVIC